MARHILFEVNYAVQTFLRAYSLANLEEIPTVNRLHGYFAMIAPGRLVGAQPTQPLIPIASGLCATGKYASTTIVGADRIFNLLDKQIPIEDRILAQLMAMHRLLQQGEPELALIGCITAVEWFLNERFPELKSRSKSGYERSASINDCLEKKVLNFLTDQDKEHLKDFSSARNSITHGSPPRRLNTVPNMKRREFVVDEEFVRDGLFLALDIYRAVNLNAVKSTNTAQ